MRHKSLVVFLLLFLFAEGKLNAQWQKLNSFGRGVISVYFFDKEGSPNTGLLSIGDYHNDSLPRGVWRTIDGGFTWTKSEIPVSTFPWTFSFKDSLVGWCGNSLLDEKYPHCWKTTDGGISWTVLTSSAKIGNFAFDLHYNKRNKTLVVFTATSQIYFSTDEGLTWNTGDSGYTFCGATLGVFFYNDSISDAGGVLPMGTNRDFLVSRWKMEGAAEY